MKKHIRKFFVGKYRRDENLPVHGLKEHFQKIQSVWQGDLYDDFGIERIFRLFLICAKLLFPGIYVQLLLSRGDYLAKKLIGEFYVLSKTLIPFFILYFGLHTQPVFQALNVYMLSETLVYIFNKIYVSEHESETAHKRSLLLLFLNYLEVVLAFAVIYASGNYFNAPFQSYLDPIYFSLITGSTIGFGDFYPLTSFGKVVVICQTLTSVSFIVLFFNFFGSKINR